MARNDDQFLGIWTRHYARQFGSKNLFILLDGQDQSVPTLPADVTVIRVPHVPATRAAGDRARARAVSHLARMLFLHYRRVVACDADELLCLDPSAGDDLGNYLVERVDAAAVSAIGLDVGQHPAHEGPLDFSAPVLRQRGYARLSARYTKAVVATRPVTWGSGFHRVKFHGLRIDPNLLLFHIGLSDRHLAEAKAGSGELAASGWSGHFRRRFDLYSALERYPAQDADVAIASARRRMLWRRPLYALNKPGTLPGNLVVRIPDRWRGFF